MSRLPQPQLCDRRHPPLSKNRTTGKPVTLELFRRYPDLQQAASDPAELERIICSTGLPVTSAGEHPSRRQRSFESLRWQAARWRSCSACSASRGKTAANVVFTSSAPSRSGASSSIIIRTNTVAVAASALNRQQRWLRIETRPMAVVRPERYGRASSIWHGRRFATPASRAVRVHACALLFGGAMVIEQPVWLRWR